MDTARTPTTDQREDVQKLTLRVPLNILERIDRACRRLGLNRNGFIVSSTVERVDRMERGSS
jgi:hypothetical protein